MEVSILHHAACFDGAASSALFAAFYRAHVDRKASFRFRARHHRPGGPYQAEDFASDDVAVLDFRYSRELERGWFFDHHRSAFQLEGEKEHFLERLASDGEPRCFYDPTAPSCTGLVARSLERSYGFDGSRYGELVAWADLIDRAGFRDARQALELDAPALRLMAFAEHNGDPELAERFIVDLGRLALHDHAREPYVERAVRGVLERVHRQISAFTPRCSVRDGVAEFNLLDLPATTWNKFLPYHCHPEARYAVGIARGVDGCIRLSAGYNPWLPESGREHDLASLCESVGGGGHPYVGGASFFPHLRRRALEAHAFLATTLRGDHLSPHAELHG